MFLITGEASDSTFLGVVEAECGEEDGRDETADWFGGVF